MKSRTLRLLLPLVAALVPTGCRMVAPNPTLAPSSASASAASTPIAVAEFRDGLPLIFREDFSGGDGRWQPTDPAAWRLVERDGRRVYEQYQQSRYEPPVRSPFNISLIRNLRVADFILEARLEQTGHEYNHRDMVVVFGYQGPAHFYYAHLATAADETAHSIFLVNGAPRVSIATERTQGIDWSSGPQAVRVERRADFGEIVVYFNGTPVMRATDRTFIDGAIGFGTFDDTGIIEEVVVWGDAR